ncbi:MAG: hypothetical protein FJW34_02340 [Acidobacteria bacterium]|nr:hypothetical protein [Acidobacteriota bacterium]
MLLAALALDVALVAPGLPAPCALAVNPQGTPFVATEKHIARVVALKTWQPFAQAAGRPAGLAFDAGGDLWMADAARHALVRITPWGQATVVAEGLKTPGQVAVTPEGEVFVTDSEAGQVLRVDSRGRLTRLASGLERPLGIAVSSGEVFVGDAAGGLWRLEPPDRKPARLAQVEGAAAALALDEFGNLYAGHGGRVSVINRAGEVLQTQAIPGGEVTGLAFGGLDLKTLYVAERSTGALYKLRVAHRSQRLPWEPDRPLRIVQPPDGAILNRHDGTAEERGLRIVVEGFSAGGLPVQVNGVSAEVSDARFRAAVLLQDRDTRITAQSGGLRDAIRVFWDRDSAPRYRFSIDDNIWFLRDIAQNADRYQSIFDNPYLAFWREMNQKHGARFHFNSYFETEGFNLPQMPDKFREEWRRNANWIRLTFHARANDPARPYLDASAEQIREDYRLVTREIRRFAGPEVLSPFTTVHWGEATRAAARALRAEGVRGLAGYFEAREELPTVCYYLPLAQWTYLAGRDYWHDTSEDLIYIRHDLVVNTVPLEQVVPRLERLAADPHQSEVLELMIHEQYFYPDYKAYQPDFRQKVERALQWVAERGYRPVFFEEGYLGAPRR